MAWLKWQFFCHAGDTEIAGFGLSSKKDLLRVVDFLVVEQTASPVTVEMEGAAIADLTDDMVDAGIPLERFMRIWLHTHPGSSVTPSGTDENTFADVFGNSHWAVMGILGRTGNTSARLQFNVGPKGSIEIPIKVDWSGFLDFNEWDFAAKMEIWRSDYDRLVKVEPLPFPGVFPGKDTPRARRQDAEDARDRWEAYYADLDWVDDGGRSHDLANTGLTPSHFTEADLHNLAIEDERLRELEATLDEEMNSHDLLSGDRDVRDDDDSFPRFPSTGSPPA